MYFNVVYLVVRWYSHWEDWCMLYVCVYMNYDELLGVLGIV